MAIIEIVKVNKGHTPKILQTKCDKVKLVNGKYDKETNELIQNLLDTAIAAKDPAAAGLSAPQIGVPKQVCVVRRFMKDPANPEKEIIKNYVLVNPKIITLSKETDVQWEACLSIPNLYGAVERPIKIKLKALDENGDEIRMKTSGFLARVVQHELDHLEGILYTEKTIGKPKTEKEIEEMLEAPQE